MLYPSIVNEGKVIFPESYSKSSGKIMVLEVDVIKLARLALGNRISKAILKRLTSKCPHGYRSRLEHILELLVSEEGGKKAFSLSCIFDYYLFKVLLGISIKLLRVSKDEFQIALKDPAVRRGIGVVFKSLVIYGVTTPQRLYTPFVIVWNFTNACNLRCKHCYQSASTSLPNELSYEEKLKVLKELDEIEVPLIALSGGEPAIHPHFIDIIREGARRGIYMAVATNGIPFSRMEFAERAVRAGLRYAEVSIDSVDPLKHDEFRGVKGAWELAIQGIRNLVKLGISVGIATTLTKLNYKEIRDMVKLGEELGVTRVVFFNFIPTGRGKDIAKLDLTPEEREEALKQIYYESTRSSIEVVATAPQLARVSWQLSSGIGVTPTHFTVPKSKSLKNLAEFVGGCGAGRIYAAIQPDGKVTPCVFMPIVIGDLRKESFSDVWRSNEVLKKLRDKDLLKPPCGECPYKYICGGCRARAYAYFSDYLAPDPGCLRAALVSPALREVYEGKEEEIAIPSKVSIKLRSC